VRHHRLGGRALDPLNDRLGQHVACGPAQQAFLPAVVGLPSTSDPQYGAAIQAQAKDLLGSGQDTLFGLIDRAALEQLTRQDPATFEPLDKARIHRVLDLAVWIDMYRPQIVF